MIDYTTTNHSFSMTVHCLGKTKRIICDAIYQ
nr:MAG TPA: hypothetical protein [Caudoviricetes sp.]